MRRRQLAEGGVHYQAPVLLPALFELAAAGAPAQAAAALPGQGLPPPLAFGAPAGAAQEPIAIPTDAAVPAVETTLRPGAVSPATLAQLWAGATGARLFAFLLYDHGVRLEGIGRCGGGHTTPVMRWRSPLAQGNWQAAGQQGTRCFLGPGAVDDKWLKSAGAWGDLCVAVDHGSGLPVPVALWPSNATPSCALCLVQLNALGYSPKAIRTAGGDA